MMLMRLMILVCRCNYREMRRCLWAIKPLAPIRRERHKPYFPRNSYRHTCQPIIGITLSGGGGPMRQIGTCHSHPNSLTWHGRKRPVFIFVFLGPEFAQIVYFSIGCGAPGFNFGPLAAQMTMESQQNFRAAVGSLIVQRHGALDGVGSISIGQKPGHVQVNVAKLCGIPLNRMLGVIWV